MNPKPNSPEDDRNDDWPAFMSFELRTFPAHWDLSGFLEGKDMRHGIEPRAGQPTPPPSVP